MIRETRSNTTPDLNITVYSRVVSQLRNLNDYIGYNHNDNVN